MALSDQQSRAESAYLSNMFLGQQTSNMLRNLQTLTVILFGFASATVECFIRRDFGSRYWNVLRLIGAWQAMRFFSFFLNLPQLLSLRFTSNTSIELHPWFVWTFVALALLHLLRNWQRERANILWHSHGFGISWLAWLPVDDLVLYRFVEPACVLAVGWLVRMVDGPTGSWLLLAGVALFVRNNMVFGTMRDRYLDMIDARIEAKYFTDAQSGRPKEETAGWHVMPMPQGGIFSDGEPLDMAAAVRATMGKAAEGEQASVEPRTQEEA